MVIIVTNIRVQKKDRREKAASTAGNGTSKVKTEASKLVRNNSKTRWTSTSFFCSHCEAELTD